MKLKVLIDYLENHAPLCLQEHYDNSGLIVGDPESEIESVLISLDTTFEVVQEAIQKRCNVIISHHPLIFKGIKNITSKEAIGRIAILAIRHSISIYAIHTNLDALMKGGVNSKIANMLNLKNIRPLLPKGPMDDFSGEAGSGLLGDFDRQLSESEFLETLKTSMRTGLIRHSALLGKKISKLAVCGGAGAFLLSQAIKEGADAFVSSDFKYHDFFLADGSILISDIGHYESEQFTIDLLFDIITDNFTNFAALKTTVTTNPIHYYH